jgi:hypothetical protein
MNESACSAHKNNLLHLPPFDSTHRLKTRKQTPGLLLGNFHSCTPARRDGDGDGSENRGSFLTATFQGDPHDGPPQKGGPFDEEQSGKQDALKLLLVQITSIFLNRKKDIFPPISPLRPGLRSTSTIFSESRRALSAP